MDPFAAKLQEHGLEPLRAAALTTLQLNLGKLCNQACKHCHVDAGPHQIAPDVNMGPEVAGLVLALLARHAFELVDITGGAPELNPSFRPLVRAARARGIRVMDRCNLTVLFEPGQEDLGRFLADQRVEITASLPHWAADATDRQRGTGAYDKSVLALRSLNALGYGTGGGLELNLVHNPVGAFLSGDQKELEADFKQQLLRRHGVRFDQLFCITNMPIRRFLDWLVRSGNEQRYRQALLDAFNPRAVPGVMCRTLVSVGPDGSLYDCDFNQMLGLRTGAQAPRHLREFDHEALAEREIVTGAHCLGCTAGAGSSCGGAIA